MWPMEVEHVSAPENSYVARKLRIGTCTRCGVDGLPPDASMCEQCLTKHRKQTLRSVRKLRRSRAAAGKCRYCGVPGVARCAACKKKQGRIPTVGGSAGGSAGQDKWRRDNDGWERYRGKGQRGAPSAAVNDDQDLISALKAFEAGRKALAYAHSPEVAALGRIQRKGARAAAAAQLALAARFIDDIVERNTDGGG